MADKDEMVQVWTGLNLLQAKRMEEILRRSEIEAFLPAEDDVMEMLGARTDYGLWVRKDDAARARNLLEEAEEEMSQALDADDEESGKISEGTNNTKEQRG